MKNTFLTSVVAMAIISPAIADDTLYKDTNIGESCTTDFLGSSSGNAANSFIAQYTANEYEISAGQYLPARAIAGTTCPANSYCPGDTYTFSETNDQGITGCPSGFTLSAAGSSAQTDCYRTCVVGDVAHSASVSGGYYYGNNNQCSAVSCVTGYHTASSYTPTHKDIIDAYTNYAGYSLEDHPELTTDEEFIAFLYDDMGEESTRDYLQLYAYAPSAETYLKTITSDADIYENSDWSKAKYKSASGTGNNSSDTSGLENGEWSVPFSYGSIKGTSKCTATNGNNYGTQGNPDATTSGEARYCWCHADSLDDEPLVSSWVFFNADGLASFCANRCADYCASFVRSYSGFRGALFGSGGAKEVCVANEITITWERANGQGSVTNTCTYDSDIILPTAPTKTGYTFSGWKLVTGSSNE